MHKKLQKQSDITGLSAVVSAVEIIPRQPERAFDKLPLVDPDDL